MKLAIVTIVHGRPLITEAFAKSIKRIYRDFGIETFAAVTPEDESLPSMMGEGITVRTYKNKPVGEKFNSAVELTKYHDFTHLMILGSDDIVSNGYIEKVLTMGDKDFFGGDGLWFWGLNPRRAGFQEFGYFDLKGFIAGTGKVLSRRVIEAVDYKPWPDACNYGMDAKLNKRIKGIFSQRGESLSYGCFKPPKEDAFIMDVKHTQHISSMSPITRRETFKRESPYDIIPKHIPGDECDYLFSLHKDAVDQVNDKRVRNGEPPIEMKL